jgi:DNA-binding HxlR family transcriptional regulator
MAKKIENIYECLKARVLLDQVADKWTLLILGSLANGPVRFNQIKRTVAGISQKTLTQTLRKLERNGLIERVILDGLPLGVEYSLTSLGESLQTPFEAVFQWIGHYSHAIEAAQKKFDNQPKRRSL